MKRLLVAICCVAWLAFLTLFIVNLARAEPVLYPVAPEDLPRAAEVLARRGLVVRPLSAMIKSDSANPNDMIMFIRAIGPEGRLQLYVATVQNLRTTRVEVYAIKEKP